jgi:nitrite reductase/ring-hydroxylating ferredoxin subunit
MFNSVLCILFLQFGPHEELSYDDFKKWTTPNCPHIFCGVHNWVYTILTGSKMPSEQVF